MVRRLDAVDIACEEWADQMREMFGLRDPRRARDYVGAIRCTLAARRDLHHGARSSKPDQRWPEFPFSGRSAVVNVVYKRLPESLQEILVAHYVATSPRSKGLRADLMGISPREYWLRVARAKAAVDGGLAIVESVCTLSASTDGKTPIRVSATGRSSSPP